MFDSLQARLRAVRRSKTLPLRCDDTVAIFLGIASVGTLRDRGSVVNVSVGVAGDKTMRNLRRSLQPQADLNGEFTREGHEFKVSDPQGADFHIDGTDRGRLRRRVVLLEQSQIGVESRQLFHRLDVFQVGCDLLLILGVESLQIVALLLLVVQVTLCVM